MAATDPGSTRDPQPLAATTRATRNPPGYRDRRALRAELFISLRWSNIIPREQQSDATGSPFLLPGIVSWVERRVNDPLLTRRL